MFKNFVETVKANKAVIIKRAAVLGGAMVGLLVIGIVLSNQEQEDEGGAAETPIEEAPEQE